MSELIKRKNKGSKENNRRMETSQAKFVFATQLVTEV